MPKNKNTRNTKSFIKRKSSKKYSFKNKNHKYKGGACNCQNDRLGGKMTGGYGPASYQPISNDYFYTYQSNPNLLPFPATESNVLDIYTTGGKKYKYPRKSKSRKSKKSKKNMTRRKMMHGGNILPQFLTSHPFGNNYVQYTGDTQGTLLGVNMINGISNNNNSITDGPLLHPESAYIA